MPGTNEGQWRAALERARERFVRLADSIEARLAPPPLFAIVRRQRGEDDVYERTKTYLSQRLEPRTGLLIPRFPGVAGDCLWPPVYRSICRDNPQQFTSMFHSLMDLEKGRYLPEWGVLCSIARDAAHSLELSGVATAILGESSSSDSVSEFLWFECLFEIALQGKLVNPSAAVRMVVLPRGNRSCAWQAEAWQQERDLNSDVLRRQQRGDPQCTTATAVPEEEWPTELPQTWFSILLDVPNRSVELIDWILAQQANGDSATIRLECREIAIEMPHRPPASGWAFQSGEADYLGHRFQVSEQQRVILELLTSTPGKAFTWDKIAHEWDRLKGVSSTSSNVKQWMCKLRRVIRSNFDCSGSDPIPNVEAGSKSAYRLDHTVIAAPRQNGSSNSP